MVGQFFGDRVAWVALVDHTLRMRAPNVEAWIERFRTYFGPVARAFDVLDERRVREYTDTLAELINLHNRATDGTVNMGCEYVNVIAIKG